MWLERKQEAGDENNMQETMMMMMMMLLLVVVVMMMMINRKFTFPVLHIQPLFPAKGARLTLENRIFTQFRAAKGLHQIFQNQNCTTVFAV